ncbi:hypothetical protein M2150_001815 [Lachnospiraceae bacterium PM6-15]|uniref:hypothetical protein n=1 Tax=Ohessyouella blattaphilus TaxID=2949333 RepID=UPI003E233393
MRYNYNEKAFQFKRQEEDGTALLIMEKSNIQLVINAAGNTILNNLPGHHNSDDLITVLKKEYPHTDERVLEHDMTEILRVFEVYDIISIEENANTKYEDGIKVSMVGDLEYKRVSEFILTGLLDNSMKYRTLEDETAYLPLHLRLRTMQNKEFGVFTERNGEVVGYFSFSGSVFDNTNVMQITNMFFKEGLETEEDDIFSIMINHVIRKLIGTKIIKKIRIPIISNGNADEVFKSRISDMGFVEECVLRDETPNGDLLFYTLYI